jgi:hypothetical protein
MAGSSRARAKAVASESSLSEFIAWRFNGWIVPSQSKRLSVSESLGRLSLTSFTPVDGSLARAHLVRGEGRGGRWFSLAHSFHSCFCADSKHSPLVHKIN